MKNIDSKTVLLIFVLLPFLIGINTIESFGNIKANIPNLGIPVGGEPQHPIRYQPGYLEKPGLIIQKNYKYHECQTSMKRLAGLYHSTFLKNGKYYIEYSLKNGVVNIFRNKSTDLYTGIRNWCDGRDDMRHDTHNSSNFDYFQITDTSTQSIKFLKADKPIVFKNLDDNTIIEIPQFDNTLPGGEDKNFEILYPKNGAKITGYTGLLSGGGTVALKFYDSKIKGKFVYSPSWHELDKVIQTGIINSTVVRYDGDSRSMANGVGLKNFKWVVAPGESVDNIVEFEMDINVTIFKKGENKELTIGVSVPSNDMTKQEVIKMYSDLQRGIKPRAESYKWMSDSLKDITLTQENADDGYIPPKPGTDEEDGKLPPDGGIDDGGFPRPPTDGNIISWLAYIIECIIYIVTYPIRLIYEVITAVFEILQKLVVTMLEFSSTFGKMFNFLPSDVRTVLGGTLAVMCIASIFRFIRGA